MHAYRRLPFAAGDGCLWVAMPPKHAADTHAAAWRQLLHNTIASVPQVYHTHEAADDAALASPDFLASDVARAENSLRRLLAGAWRGGVGRRASGVGGGRGRAALGYDEAERGAAA